MAATNGNYESYAEALPVGTRVLCEREWRSGKWKIPVIRS